MAEKSEEPVLQSHKGRFMNSNTLCPVCRRGTEFVEHRGRPNEYCTVCGSLVRTRAVYLAIEHFGLIRTLAEREVDVAHFAPERALFVILRHKLPKVRYRCFDIEPERYTFAKGEIEHTDLCDDASPALQKSYDLILHNHVLEHVPASVESVLGKLGNRLNRGGLQVFTIPVRVGGFDEDLNPALTKEERIKRFGQEDHFRIFGNDDCENMLQKILKQDDVVLRLPSFLSRADAEKYGVTRLFESDLSGDVTGNTIFYHRKTKNVPAFQLNRPKKNYVKRGVRKILRQFGR